MSIISISIFHILSLFSCGLIFDSLAFPSVSIQALLSARLRTTRERNGADFCAPGFFRDALSADDRVRLSPFPQELIIGVQIIVSIGIQIIFDKAECPVYRARFSQSRRSNVSTP
jgi:hypothetical protein